MTGIKSPITNKFEVSKVGFIRSDIIERLYLEKYNLNISRFFADISEIWILKCNETNFEFYYPVISGDEKFYNELGKKEWYHRELAWEYDCCLKYINRHQRVLEIGSGNFSFVRKLVNLGYRVDCTEYTEELVNLGLDLGLNCQLLNDFSVNLEGMYDVICAFQVLEHIEDINSFFQFVNRALSAGGVMIIAVPNNKSFVGLDMKDCLNMPPHHIGRWTPGSLSKVANYYGFSEVSVDLEPLKSEHVAWYLRVKFDAFFRYHYISAALAALIKPFIVKRWRDRIAGHTFMGVFKKSPEPNVNS